MSRLNSATLAALQAFATWSVLSAAIPMTAMAADKTSPTQVAAAAKIATVAVQGTAASANESSLDAVVEAVRQTTVSAQVPGAIVSLLVQAGDRVRAGQALVRIDARAAQQNVAGSAAQVDAAQAVLNVASKELDRQKQLLAKQYISQAALERTQAQWLAAQAQVKALQAQTRVAEAQSGFFVLSAPYDGIVSEVTATVGDMAMPGRPLLVLHDPSALRVVASVPQSMLTGLSDKLKSVRYEIPGLADVLLGQQLLLTIEFFAGDVENGLGRVNLCSTAGDVLLGGACVDPHQGLTRTDTVTGLHQKRDDGARNLRRHGGLAHGFDHAVQAGLVGRSCRALCALNYHGGDLGCSGDLGRRHFVGSHSRHGHGRCRQHAQCGESLKSGKGG